MGARSFVSRKDKKDDARMGRRAELFFKTPAELKERLRERPPPTAAGYGSFNLVNKDKKAEK